MTLVPPSTIAHAIDFPTRLARLERQNARLRLALIAAFAAIGVVGVAGAVSQKPAQTIETGKLVLVDADGKRRAELGMRDDAKDAVALCLYDKDGGKRVQLTAGPDDAGLSLIQNGELRAALTARSSKHVMLLLQKEKFEQHKNQMAMGYMDDGKPAIFINDENAKTILALPGK